MACKAVLIGLIVCAVQFSCSFAFKLPNVKHAYHTRANIAKVSCQATGGMSRKSALFLTGTFPLWAASVMAADEEEEEEALSPGSVPREVTYKVDDELCSKHPKWKQCRKKTFNSMAPQVALPNGIVVQDLSVGKGYAPEPGDTCTVHYSLYYQGDEIESSRESSGLAARPIGFQYGVEKGTGSVIPAISLGMEGMRVGGVRRITSPPEFAFGDKGKKPRIPPGATVQFDVQLLTVKRAGTNPITRQGSGSEKNTGLFDLF